MKWGVGAAAGLFLLSALLPRLWTGAALPPLGSPPSADHAVQDVAAALGGARRFGGDLAFIQLLQYFGGGDKAEATEDEDHPHGPGESHSHASWLPRFLPLSLRIAALSPCFHEAFLFAAGSLGFVLDRPDDALVLLERVSGADPTFWRYRIYAGAIAYRRDASPVKTVALLEEALKYPDCPSLLQNILANLHKKLGHYDRAAAIFRFTMETSRDPGAVNTARLGLERLRKEGRVP
jgi:tetratricopeptide (TPR) repeat protein